VQDLRPARTIAELRLLDGEGADGAVVADAVAADPESGMGVGVERILLRAAVGRAGREVLA
jgi:hypothetical protein